MVKRKTSVKSILLAIFISLFIIFLLFSCFIGSQVVLGSTQLVTNEETKGIPEGLWEKYNMDYDSFCEKYTIETVSLKSTHYEHNIPVDFIYEDKNSTDIVIMVHGLGDNRYSNYPIAEFFLENGYSVITYDQRSTNENTAEKTTFGYMEKYDLIDCINYAKVFAKGNRVIIWGTSYGGATAIQAVNYDRVCKDVKYLILDCPVSNMEWMVEEEIKKMDIPLPTGYMVWCGSVMNDAMLGFSYNEVDSAELAKSMHVPTLVINSKVDNVTPYFMGKEIYDNLPDIINEENRSRINQLWTVEDSKHAEVWLDHNEEYRNTVNSFIQGCYGYYIEDKIPKN